MDVEMVSLCRSSSEDLWSWWAGMQMLVPGVELSAAGLLDLTVKAKQRGLRGHRSGSGCACPLVSIAME